ncbi:hypothetical protein QJS66_02835 [Kocuria rhizophila]|nr:hypothetical protein QJS66_02835 [Kocuria rhizophila]
MRSTTCRRHGRPRGGPGEAPLEEVWIAGRRVSRDPAPRLRACSSCGTSPGRGPPLSPSPSHRQDAPKAMTVSARWTGSGLGPASRGRCSSTSGSVKKLRAAAPEDMLAVKGVGPGAGRRGGAGPGRAGGGVVRARGRHGDGRTARLIWSTLEGEPCSRRMGRSVTP